MVKAIRHTASMTREYGQYCGLARALELVGSRWTLLIVRELLTGPKRYTELAQGLPGIPTNVLSSRLRDLEDAGLVQRELQARPSTSVAYTLTPYGLELEEPVERLGLWGAKSLGKPTSRDTFSMAALSIALRATFNSDAAQRPDLLVEIRFEHQRLHVHIRDGRLTFPPQPPDEPHLVLTTAPNVFAELFGGYIDVDSAISSGRLRLHGPKRDARRFFRLFHLPSAAAERHSEAPQPGGQ